MVERLSGSGTETVRSSDRLLELSKPYAEMGMYAEEIVKALYLEHALISDKKSVATIVGVARKKGNLRKLTSEESGDIEKDKNHKDAQGALTKERVFKWLLTRATLIVSKSQMPTDRLGWKGMIQELEETEILENIVSSARPLILRNAPPLDIVKILNSPATATMSDEEKSIEFTRRCLKEGIIGSDLSNWEVLVRIYNASQKKLPIGFCDKFRLELFLSARHDAEKGDIGLLMRYNQIGEIVDSEWFSKSLSEEEDFIAGVVRRAPKSGTDELGHYRLDTEGRKWRQYYGLGENGGIVYFGSRVAP